MPAPTSPYTRQQLARELLLYKMKEYSQDCFCATWQVGLEWNLWHATTRADSSPIAQLTAEASRACRALSEIANGWCIFTDAEQPNSTGPVFVSTERWMKILNARFPDYTQ